MGVGWGAFSDSSCDGFPSGGGLRGRRRRGHGGGKDKQNKYVQYVRSAGRMATKC